MGELRKGIPHRLRRLEDITPTKHVQELQHKTRKIISRSASDLSWRSVFLSLFRIVNQFSCSISRLSTTTGKKMLAKKARIKQTSKRVLSVHHFVSSRGYNMGRTENWGIISTFTRWRHGILRHCCRSTTRRHTSPVPLYHLSRLCA